jgi:hypothetical protein
LNHYARLWIACLTLLFAAQARAATIEEVDDAIVLLAEGRYAAAEARFDRILAEGVSEALIGDLFTDQAQTYRALTRIAQGKLDAAAEDAAALAKPRSALTPSEFAKLLDGLLKLHRGDKAGALAAYDQAVRQAAESLGGGARQANALSLRAWAKLYFGDTDGARADFEAAHASDGVILFQDSLNLEKPFWRALIDEALPLFAAGKTQEGIDRIDAIVTRLGLLEKARRHAKDVGIQGANEAGQAKHLLGWEVQGGLAAWRARAAAEAKEAAAQKRVVLQRDAQQALLENDPQRAFEAYVNAFRQATDADGRDQALAGIATTLRLLPSKPAVPEEVRRMLIKAKVLVEEKDYAAAIELYFQAYRQAPWHAQLYYDRALLIGQSARRPADFDTAIHEMRRFLTLAADSPDARAAQDKIYEWEVRRERAARQAAAEITPKARGALATTAGSEDCFIATAAFGSPLEPHVATLRAFRDRQLLPHAAGRWLVARYYEYSPPIADFIREREALRALVRALLVPVVFAIAQPAPAFLLLAVALLGIAAWRRQRA